MDEPTTSTWSRFRASATSLVPAPVRAFAQSHKSLLSWACTAILMIVSATIGAVWEDVVQDFWKYELLAWLGRPSGIDLTNGSLILWAIGGLFSTVILLFIGFVFARDNKALERSLRQSLQRERELQKRLDDAIQREAVVSAGLADAATREASLRIELDEAQDQVQTLTSRVTALEKVGQEFARRLLAQMEIWATFERIMISQRGTWDEAQVEDAIHRHVVQVVWGCADLMGAHHVVSGSVALRDEDTPYRVRLAYPVGINVGDQGMRWFCIGDDERYKHRRGVAGYAFKAETLQVAHDVTNDHRFAWSDNDPRPRESAVQASIVASPIFSEGQAIGVLSLDGRTPNCFDEARLTLVMEYACSSLGRVLELRQGASRAAPE